MIRPGFRSIDLRYGCHQAMWDLPEGERPVVIAGPNGSGKTTLVEGLLRTLFGFDRRRGADATQLEGRRPWDRREMRGVVTLARNGETFGITRDFSTDRVRVHSPEEGVNHFEGDGNPGGRNQEARRYRQILTDVLGLSDLDSYACTLFIRQGALPETSLGEHLLRVAAGGHARVSAARREIAEAHRVITRRPIHSGATAAVNARELEKLNEEISAIEARLEAARAAGDRRGPLTLERDHTKEKLETLDAEVRLLEDAQSALARSGALEAEGRHLREWVRMLDRLEDEVRADAKALRDARADSDRAAADGLFPDDFAERLARADLRWRDLEDLRGRSRLWPGIAGAVLIAGATAAYLAGFPIAAVVAGGAGLLGLVLWLAFRIDASRRAAGLRRQLRDALGDVPGGAGLKRENRDEYLARFEAQRTTARRLEEARLRMAERMREARHALRDAAAVGIITAARAPERTEARREGRPDAEPAERLADRLHASAAAARSRLGRDRSEIDRVGDASLRLPDGVPPTEDAVADALRQRRQDRARVQAQLQEIGQQLLERGTPSESVGALEAALSRLVPQRDALLRKAEVLEAAHALITDAYDAFRARDQERLVRSASDHALKLSRGAIGPIVAPEMLEDAKVRAHDHMLPMSSPPLSFGEYHTLMLGIRMGAADFLGGVGILPPLIVDEPFAHLDQDRARAVWDLLERASSERQVIVTTQDSLLLDHLGVQPDIQLGAAPDRPVGQPEPAHAAGVAP